MPPPPVPPPAPVSLGVALLPYCLRACRTVVLSAADGTKMRKSLVRWSRARALFLACVRPRYPGVFVRGPCLHAQNPPPAPSAFRLETAREFSLDPRDPDLFILFESSILVDYRL